MSKIIFVFLLGLVLETYATVSKTPIDLMNEGRFEQARSILDSTPASARYLELLNAMTETDAMKACAMYMAISQNYPNSDCDSVAQERLKWAVEMGIDLAAIREENKFTEIVQPNQPSTESVVEHIQPNQPPVETVAEHVQQDNAPAKPEDNIAEHVQPDQPQTAGETNLAAQIKAQSVQPETVEPKAQTNAEEAPSSVTIDYAITEEPKPKAGELVQAVATKEQSMVVSEPEKEPETQISTPVETEKEPEPTATTGDLAYVQPLSDPGKPHDLETDANGHGIWYVQVGAFGNHENAHKLAAKIRSSGYRVILVPRASESGTLMQVRIGGYETIEESRDVAKQLKAEFSVPTDVVNK